MVSALTVLGLAEHESRYGSYVALAEAMRSGPWTRPADTTQELFRRMVFNVLVGNNDDHLRNHAAFWDGHELTLTPAYDIAPSPRSTSVSNQAIGIARDGRRSSQLWLCRDVAGAFLMSRSDADAVIDAMVDTIRAQWADVCDQVGVSAAERAGMWGREFLNRYVFYDQP